MLRTNQHHRSAPLHFTTAFIDVKREQSFPVRAYENCATIGYCGLNVIEPTNSVFGFINWNYLRSHVNLMPPNKTNSCVATKRAGIRKGMGQASKIK